MDYVVVKLNFNLQLNFNVGEKLAISVKRESGFYLAYGLRCCQIEFQLQIEIAIWIFKLQLKFNFGEKLAISVRRESGFYLAYGLRSCQIEFELQIEIAIWNVKLQFQFAIEFQCWGKIGKFS